MRLIHLLVAYNDRAPPDCDGDPSLFVWLSTRHKTAFVLLGPRHVNIERADSEAKRIIAASNNIMGIIVVPHKDNNPIIKAKVG